METNRREFTEKLRTVWRRLHEFCAAREWRGYDPYDGLNSPLARLLPGKAARQAWTQFHRRSPINFRPLVGIQPTLNPKALALFAMGSGDRKFLDMLEELRTPEGGWGYPFDWQSRAFLAPRGTPNLICTAFAERAFGQMGNRAREGAPTSRVGKEFIENHLLRERGGERWITYIGNSDTQVHNVNMIGAALLGRRDCMEFSVNRQRPDGSWWYGESENQRWIDNFHSGYNLVALKEYEATTGDTGFLEAARRGYEYWDETFWTAEFAPRYYHDRVHPYDLHCSAQGILTHLAYGNLEKANSVAQWSLQQMWDERGFFWYQRGRRSVNRICYMRWTQAWMYCALAQLIKANETTHR
jgi:hypothetical protein